MLEDIDSKKIISNSQVVPYVKSSQDSSQPQPISSTALTAMKKIKDKVPEPNWHASWELSSVVSGHLGWVRSIAFDASNEWFVTGSADRTIKVLSDSFFKKVIVFFN